MATTRKITRVRARDLRLVSHILLALQLLSIGHLFFVRHVTCPTHGDIMHVEHPAAISPAAEGADLPIRPVLASSEDTAGPEHDHCLVCSHDGRRVVLTGPTLTCAAPTLVVRSVQVEATAFFAPIDLLLLSPKNSPPSA
jgi:hypothetical protein